MSAPRRALALLALAAAAAATGTGGCDPQKADWGLEAIEGMRTPPDPPLTCGAAIPPDSQAAARAACAFTAGAQASETLGVAAPVLASLPIRHVIVVMKENRSFDHLLGRLHDLEPAVEAVPASYQNPDAHGMPVFPYHATTTCIPWDPGHQAASVSAGLDGGRMDGFVRSAASTTGTSGDFVMSYYEPSDLPFYYFLASAFAVADRDFAPMASGTFGNRDFLLFGSNAGVVDTGISFPPPETPSLLQLLMNAGYTWAVYADGSPFSGALDWGPADPGVHPLSDLFAALDAGTLPNVAFVDGLDYVEDDHPTADLQRGEAWLAPIYAHAVASPEWPRLAIIWTYDEAGGFADHVPPPPACAATPRSPFTARGPRVPLVVISPWARRGYVSHVVRDHTAITRLIEALFDLPALTARDANSDALLDLFDFSCGRDLTAPVAPAPGTGGCR